MNNFKSFNKSKTFKFKVHNKVFTTLKLPDDIYNKLRFTSLREIYNFFIKNPQYLK